MKKDKLSAVIVFLVILFIVFALGLFVGKKLSPQKSKEGVIKESSLKTESNPPVSPLNIIPNQKAEEKTPVSTDNIKFAPISKLASLKNGNAAKKPVEKPTPPPEPKTKVRTKIVYVKKPIYIYKYITKKPAVKQKTAASPFASKVYYTIQVAALSKYNDAKKLADKLNSMGFFAYIVPISISGKKGKAVYEQVRVGKFSTNAGAKSVENIISKKFNLKPYIIKVD
ncbi:MAG: SPOR domain-containing protein [Deltaproteobacteria bacterium]|nr:SPOR domain-containing protein [Deltaproteobacteria bacterium]MCL5880256.1 SPOR domain-containing protein [Deltaproteobacteria bacterium]MDA8303570.1 SPOR domain-containing protein [Deltaproteobacteria bacterium]